MRRMIRVLALPVLLLAAGWTGWWLYGLGLGRAELARLESDATSSGIRVRCGSPSWSGFPIQIRLDCQPFSLDVTATGETVLEVPHLQFLAQIFDAGHILAVADGAMQLSNQKESLTLAPTRFVASFRHSGPEELAVFGEQVETGSGFAASLLNMRLTRDSGGDPRRIVFALEARDAFFGLPIAADTPFEQVTATGSVSTADAASLAAPALLGALKLEGTVLQIESLRLHQKDVTVSGRGTIAVDEASQLDGKLNLTIENAGGLIGRFEAAGLLTPSEARNGTMLLGLLAGDTGKVRISLQANDGEIFLGPVKLGRLKPFSGS
jgi:hypothetical protein